MDMQCHLPDDARKRLHQEVGRAHARLDRAEEVLNRLTPLAHLFGIFVEPALHVFENMIMLPAVDLEVAFVYPVRGHYVTARVPKI
jgi:hypothetical protein